MPRIRKLFVLILLLAVSAFAGQSINLSINTGTAASPTRGLLQEFRHEFQVTNWAALASLKTLVYDSGDGVQVAMDATNLLVGDIVGEAPSGYATLALAGRSNVLVRAQRNLTTSTFDVEFWNVDGTGYVLRQIPITTPAAASSGISFGATGADVELAWYRKLTTLVALGGQPPTTYTAETTYSWWKFDTSLVDSSGNGRTVTWTSPSYSTTPGQVAYAFLKTYGAPTWSDWTSLRSGFSNQLDGASSYSMADTSNTVTYQWQQTAGPSNVQWSSRTAAQPAVTGTTFGTYTFLLTVTDLAATTSTDTLQVGFSAYDSNGVTIYPDSRLDKVFGPTIAFGQNPWPFHDKASIQTIDYHVNTLGYNGGPLTQEWLTPLAGTVSFTAGSTTLTGSGTNFQTDFCNGGTTPGSSPIVIWWDVTTAVGGYGPIPKYSPSNISRAYADIASCDSATQITLSQAWVYSSGTQTGKQYSRQCCGFWYSTGGGATYYDGALGYYAMYYRSGNEKYLTAARWVTDGWMAHGVIGYGASVQVFPRVQAGSSLFVRAFIDNEGDTSNIPYIRQLGTRSGYPAPGPTVLISDPREDAYIDGFRALQAMLDPDATEKATGISYMEEAWVNRWNGQQQVNGNYWSNYYENNFGGGNFNPVNGSAIVTGSSIPSIKCTDNPPVSDTATASVTNGSFSVTGGSGWSGTTGMLAEIYGQRAGNYYIFSSIIAGSTANTLTLGLAYDGTTNLSGTIRVRILSGTAGYTALWFATNASPPVQEQTWYTCTYNSATQITLDRPYEGTTGAKLLARANLAGRGSQPFMMGIVGLMETWAIGAMEGVSPTYATNYTGTIELLGEWMRNYGYNPATGGLWYGIDFNNCLPLQYYNCSLSPAEDRDLGAETTALVSKWYLANPTQDNKDWGDEYYGNQWSQLGGPYSDGIYNQYNDATLWTQGKYLGFAFGIGMSHQWPAARVGGVAPADTATIPITCALPTAKYPTVAKQKVLVKLPTGVVEEFTSTCATPTMNITIDHRYNGGWYLRKIQHLTAGDVVVTSSDYQKAIAIAAQ